MAKREKVDFEFKDKPVTKEDIEKEDIGDRYIIPLLKVQSAKRGVLADLDKKINISPNQIVFSAYMVAKEIIEKWFQIDDGNKNG